jgi:hypothetical protein
MPLALRLNGKANLNRTFRIPTIQSRIPTSSECRSAGVSLYPSSRICGEYQPRQSQFTRSDIYRACANGELGLAFVYDKDLLVWMPMETRSTAWRYIDEDQRDVLSRPDAGPRIHAHSRLLATRFDLKPHIPCVLRFSTKGN